MPWQSEGFTDLHSHLVPGVDDGSRTLVDSADGLRRLRDAGVRRIVTTPHLDGSLTRDRGLLEARLHEVDVAWEALHEMASTDFPELEIRRGHEVMLDVPDPDLSPCPLPLFQLSDGWWLPGSGPSSRILSDIVAWIRG